jgi:hypothetical protein
VLGGYRSSLVVKRLPTLAAGAAEGSGQINRLSGDWTYGQPIVRHSAAQWKENPVSAEWTWNSVNVTALPAGLSSRSLRYNGLRPTAVKFGLAHASMEGRDSSEPDQPT